MAHLKVCVFYPAAPWDTLTSPAVSPNMLRGRNSATSADEQPHIGNYRALKTIGKGNLAKVKLARHILTGERGERRTWDTAASPTVDTPAVAVGLPPRQPSVYQAEMRLKREDAQRDRLRRWRK